MRCLRATGTYPVLCRSARDVPQADGSVIRTTDEVALHERTPGKAVALSLVSSQSQIWIAVVVGWLGRVLAVVKDIHLSADGLGGNHEGVLGHVARSIDLTLMVDLLNHLDFACCNVQLLSSDISDKLDVRRCISAGCVYKAQRT